MTANIRTIAAKNNILFDFMMGPLLKFYEVDCITGFT